MGMILDEDLAAELEILETSGESLEEDAKWIDT